MNIKQVHFLWSWMETAALSLQQFIKCFYFWGTYVRFKTASARTLDVAAKLATRGVDAATLNQMKTIDKERRIYWSRSKGRAACTVSAEIAQAFQTQQRKCRWQDCCHAKTLLKSRTSRRAWLSWVLSWLDLTTTYLISPHESVPVGADGWKMSKFVARYTTPSLLEAKVTGIWVRSGYLRLGARQSVGARFLFYKGLEQDFAVLSIITGWACGKEGYCQLYGKTMITMLGTGQ